MTGNQSLTDRDRELLDFTQRAPRAAGAKEEAIRKELGMSPVRYYRRLNILLDYAPAMQEYPLLVKRLRRVRNRRAVTSSDDAEY
ncbi:DUF3263 domain-containing protein [Corynebacterium sp. MNWGS58]|uniref:DUF3263 domain-containing protein n=1 Tax=Corynebacterium sp. 102791.4 TaxID=3104612 RepID=UPI003510DE54